MKVSTDIKSGQGLGDAVADLTHLTGIDQVAKFYTRTTGRSCGCQERRQQLNQVFPSLFNVS